MMFYAFIWTVTEVLLEDKRNELKNEPSEEEIATETGSSGPRGHEFYGTEYPQDQEVNDDWDDVFYDAPTDDNNLRR
jgi:hypothetical protein